MKKILNVIASILLILAMVFLFLAIKEQLPFEKAKGENQALKEIAVMETETDEPTGNDYFTRNIDFGALQSINPDIVAWITVPNTNIDYPVLIGSDDTTYLNYNYNKEWSVLGSIFAFSDTAKDLSDAHICLFGHNMASPQMFGELRNYRNADFANANRNFYIYTPKSVTEYEIFSIYDCISTDSTFLHKMNYDSKEFQELISHMQVNNTINMGTTVEEKKQIVTLSACSNYGTNPYRFTVNAVEKQKKIRSEIDGIISQ